MARRKLQFVLFSALLCGTHTINGATLTGSFTPISQGSVIDLTTEGPLDWVHWGLYNETSLNRKATVAPQIGDFKVVDATNGFAQAYHYADNYNGYSWNDGNPTVSVTNTPTGVWAYGTPNIGSGFEFTVPADTSARTLKVFVGTFAARARFTASLSDGSAASYTDSSLSNMGNGPGGFYTITYAANTAGQFLTARWVVSQAFRPDGNATLQAAALTAPGANNPPFVMVRSPQNNASFTALIDITIEADAFDPDGSVDKIEFFEGSNKLGEATNSPYTLVWKSVAPGRYLLAAQATDNGGTASTSAPVRIFVGGSGSSLSGSVALPPASVDLTAEGISDWAHWGLSSAASFNHKAGIPQQISNFTKVGSRDAQQYADNYTAYSWSDGTPTAGTNDTRTGVFMYGLNNGFMLSAPADTNSRTLKVYVGLYGAQGDFQAYLSDFSAPAYTDTSLSNVFGNAYAVYTLAYAAASAGQTLFVEYKVKTLFDADFGNVTLQAATLSGSASTNTPIAVTMLAPAVTSDQLRFDFQTEMGARYTVQFTDSLNPINWLTLTNLTGDGSIASISDAANSGSERFYRVKAE
jgi:hypothetical protein